MPKFKGESESRLHAGSRWTECGYRHLHCAREDAGSRCQVLSLFDLSPVLQAVKLSVKLKHEQSIVNNTVYRSVPQFSRHTCTRSVTFNSTKLDISVGWREYLSSKALFELFGNQRF